MPVTELATLQLKPGKEWADILPHIRDVSREQSSWSGYPLYFFDDAHTAGLIYLLSGWESVEAHERWIASPMNQSLVQALEPHLDILGLQHLTIAPDESWSDAITILYARTKGEKPMFSEEGVIWKGFGADVEGKVEGSVHLVAYKTDGLKSVDSELDQQVCWLRRHDVD